MTPLKCAADTLTHRILSGYLFDSDQGFNFEEDAAKDPRLNLVAQRLFDELVAVSHPGRPDLVELEWDVPSRATAFAKVQAAFRIVKDKYMPCPKAAQRGDLVEYYRFIRDEQLKESRLSFWNVVSGGVEYSSLSDPFQHLCYMMDAYEPTLTTISRSSRGIDKAELRKLTGSKVGELFRSWLTENPECFNRIRLDLAGMGLEYLPPEIGLFSKLQALILDDNSLTELPPEIGHLTQLQVLSIEESHLKSLPAEIGKLTKLEALNLRGVLSLKDLPQEMESLTQLRNLSLEGVEILPRFIGKMDIVVFVSRSLFESFSREVQAINRNSCCSDSRVVLSEKHFEKLEEIGYFDESRPQASISRNKSLVPRAIYLLFGIIFVEVLLAITYPTSNLIYGEE